MSNTSSDPSLHARPSRVSPIETESVACGFGDFLGGPVGRFAAVGRQRWWTPVRTLVSIALVFLSFGFLSKANCLTGSPGDDGVINLDWSGNRQYVSACYNDIVPLYGGRGLDGDGFPYAYSWVEGDLTRYLEYPVLTGLFQGNVAWLTRLTYPIVDALSLPIPEASWYFALTALALSALWVLTIRMVAELAGNRIWDTVLVAASPLIIVHAFTNWDIPAIAAAVAAMYAFSRGRPGLAGMFIGLGVALKLWPLFLLGAYLVLAIRSSKYRPFLLMLATSAGTWLLINLPVMLVFPEAWNEFLRLNRERGWEWTTIYAMFSRSTGWSGFDPSGATPTILNAVSFALFAGSCVAIGIFGLRVQRRPRVAELVFLILVAFLIFNKVWSPQYSLWLVVPAVLALPRWRLLLTWMSIDALVWPFLMWHMLGVENKGIPGELLDVVLIVRLALLIAMVVLVVGQMLGKLPDKVLEAHDGQDPLAFPVEPSHKQ